MHKSVSDILSDFASVSDIMSDFASQLKILTDRIYAVFPEWDGTIDDLAYAIGLESAEKSGGNDGSDRSIENWTLEETVETIEDFHNKDFL